MRIILFLIVMVITNSSIAQKTNSKPTTPVAASGLIVPGTVLLYHFKGKDHKEDFDLLLKVKKLMPLELEYAFADGGNGRTGMIYVGKSEMDTSMVLVTDLKRFIVDKTINLPEGSLPLLLSKKLINDLKKNHKTLLRLSGEDPAIFEGGMDPDFSFEFSTAINKKPSLKEKQYIRFNKEDVSKIDGLKSVHLESSQRQMYFWLNPELPLILYIDSEEYQIRLNAIF